MQDDDIITHAIGAYSFLIPGGEQRSSAEFGELIRTHRSHYRCKIIAEAIEKSGLKFTRAINGAVSASADPDVPQRKR